MASRLSSWARDGLLFDVRDSGPVDGEAVVCLHGFPQDGTAYDDVARRLATDGLRVLVPDQRGYSPGARPAGRSAYVLEVLADDVIALLDAAGVQKAHVVGHDWGGAVAWFLASRRSNRVRSLTVLSTPHPAAIRAEWWRSTQWLRSSYMAVFQVPGLPELMVSLATGRAFITGLRRSGLSGEQAAHYTARMREPGAIAGALGWYRSIPVSRGRGAGRVAVPTTYVVGRRDPFFSSASVRRTAELVTGPRRLVELDAGHWLPENCPGDVADAVRAQVRGSVTPGR
jgi:pimeloyl-ACP methyl ester carboxylesterase